MSIYYPKFYTAPDSYLDIQASKYDEIIRHAQRMKKEIFDIKQNRENMRRHRARMNEYASFYEKDYDPDQGATEPFLRRIQCELKCTRSHAETLAEIIRKRVNNQIRAKRNAQIILLSEHMSVKQLSDRFNISRQQIHNIIKKKALNYY